MINCVAYGLQLSNNQFILCGKSNPILLISKGEKCRVQKNTNINLPDGLNTSAVKLMCAQVANYLVKTVSCD